MKREHLVMFSWVIINPAKPLVGSIHIKMHDGVVRVLTNVRHVPKLKRNFISLGALDAKGYTYVLKMESQR